MAACSNTCVDLTQDAFLYGGTLLHGGPLRQALDAAGLFSPPLLHRAPRLTPACLNACGAPSYAGVTFVRISSPTHRTVTTWFGRLPPAHRHFATRAPPLPDMALPHFSAEFTTGAQILLAARQTTTSVHLATFPHLHLFSLCLYPTVRPLLHAGGVCGGRNARVSLRSGTVLNAYSTCLLAPHLSSHLLPPLKDGKHLAAWLGGQEGSSEAEEEEEAEEGGTEHRYCLLSSCCWQKIYPANIELSGGGGEDINLPW